MHLEEIRLELEACENSILFALYERNRWARNPQAYHVTSQDALTNKEALTSIPKRAELGSLFDTLLRGTEVLHASVGRYRCPEEHPFYFDEVSDTSKEHRLNRFLDPTHRHINHNARLLGLYFEQILPQITREGQCENPGSSVTADIQLLQALSRRIHLGKVVAESKQRNDPSLGMNPETTDETLLAAITYPQVELAILDRIRTKAQRLEGQSPSAWSERVVAVFRDIIIPETKAVQIEYMRTKA